MSGTVGGAISDATPKEAAIMADKRAKIERLRARGIDPYAAVFGDRTAIAAFQAAPASGRAGVRVAGRLMGRRHHGHVVFMDLRDSSAEIEILCLRDELGEEGHRLIADIDVGDIIGVVGSPAENQRGELVVKAHSLVILGKALLVPPARSAEPPDRHMSWQEADLIAGDATREMIRTRNTLKRFLRHWFDARGFLEVDTPELLPHASGSNARPFVTRGRAIDSDLYLRISIEQHLKRLTAGGFEDVYELGTCFRNEGMSKRHHFEFTMLEWLQGYRNYHDTMDLIEAVVTAAAEEVFGKLRFERDGGAFDLTRPWRRITAREAIREKTGVDIMSADRETLTQLAKIDGDPNPDWPDLVAAVYGRLVEPRLAEPTFVIDFPRETFPLGRQHPEVPELGESFEAVIAGIEIASGTTNLNDPDEQQMRFAEQQTRNTRAQGANGLHSLDDQFVRTLAYGMMPVTGAGLGVDRVLMLLMERDSLRDVIPWSIR